MTYSPNTKFLKTGWCALGVILSVFLCQSFVWAQHEDHSKHDSGNMQQDKLIDHASHGLEKSKTESGTIWTCSMHPHIRLPKPGKCPICHMDLIPVTTDTEDDSGLPSLKLSERAKKLMEIQTSHVEQKWVSREVRLVGKVDYDETKVKHITAWVPGRIDRLYIDYTGISVRENDHMVLLYSPELLSAQEELIQASRAIGRLGSDGSAMVKRSTRRSVEASREKLRLLGLTEGQVRQIEKKGKANEHVTIYAPMGGVVVQKHINEGMYVQTGTKVYTIADLSHLWIYLDAYESDLPWIRYGQTVTFTAEAFPGEKFQGVVSFVQPFLEDKTRTVRVRVNVENKELRLKPGLFVTAMIEAKISASGQVLGPSFSGQYVCPMHPEVVQGHAGDCPICGMELAEAESLPFVGHQHDEDAKPPLVVPVSAPLITGKRAIVYVKHPDESRFEGREVVLGPRAGNYYIVKEGLHEGEEVVTNGSFKLDADLQIQGKVSMMNPEGVSQSTGHDHGGAHGGDEAANSEHGNETHSSADNSKKPLDKDAKAVLEAYLKLSNALSSDDIKEAEHALHEIGDLANKLDVKEVVELFGKQKQFDDLNKTRNFFGLLSKELLPRFEEFDVPDDLEVFKAHCPMALDGEGAHWLQKGKDIKNPFFGASMLSCGSLKGEL